MGTVISNLKARFGVDTSDFKKGLKEGEKATEDFKDAAGSSLDEFASMFGINMKAVDDALKTVGKSLNFLGQSFTAAAKGADVMAVSMKVLKFALVSTGIGAIVVALGSLIAYFTKSGEGADKFAKILDQVKSVVNNVIERLAIFGKGLFEIATGKFKQGWETMRGAFKGLGDEIKEDWKAAGDLADRFDALEDKEIALITIQGERRAKASELRLLAKEETEDQRKKLSLLNEAASVYKTLYGVQISLEKERLAIMKERLALQTTDSTDEQLKEIADQEDKLNVLAKERDDTLKGITREINTATAAIENQATSLKKLNNIKPPQVLDAKFHENLQKSMSILRETTTQVAEQTSALYQVLGKVSLDMTREINGAFEQMAFGFGEFLGALTSGDAGIKDFGKLIASTFADLAINVGKIAIGTGLAVLGIKKALATLNPIVAIAAGVGLVALGSAIKGALSNAASGAGSGSASEGSSYSAGSVATSSAQAQPFTINLVGKLVAEGKDLVYVIDQETTRKRVTT